MVIGQVLSNTFDSGINEIFTSVMIEQLNTLKGYTAKVPQNIIIQIAVLCLLAYIAYLSARFTWFVVSPSDASASVAAEPLPPKPVETVKRIDVSAVQRLHLFGQYQAQKPTAVPVAKVQDAPETRLRLTLAGVVASDFEQAGAAIIEYQGVQETYGIGDTISKTRATLEQVLHDRVLIEQSGRLETLMLDGVDYKKTSASLVKEQRRQLPPEPMAPSEQVEPEESFESPEPMEVGDQAVDDQQIVSLSESVSELRRDLSDDPGKITDYLKITPKRVAGKIVGYQLMPGADKAFFEAAGLQPGDVAIQMNGFDLTQPEQAAQALKALREESELSLTIERNEEVTEILFSINN